MKKNSEDYNTIFILPSVIEEETVASIVSSIDFDYTGIDIYVNSLGGSAFVTDQLIHIFENNFDVINMYANGNMGSAAFDLFFKINATKRQLIGQTSGMIHKAEWEHTVSYGYKTDEAALAKQNFIEKYNNVSKSFYTNVLKFTKEELNTIYEKELDLYFTNVRLNELIENVRKFNK